MVNVPSTKPYLIRAIHEWAVDNGFTPQILVATDHDDVVVPAQHVTDNKIVLNLHPQSVRDLNLGNDYLMCSARFSGKAFELTVPVSAVIAIYARENGQGVVFQNDNGSSPDPSDDDGNGTGDDGGQPGPSGHLKLVK